MNELWQKQIDIVNSQIEDYKQKLEAYDQQESKVLKIIFYLKIIY